MDFKKLFITSFSAFIALTSFSQKEKTVIIVDKENSKKQKEYSYPNRPLVENVSVTKFSPLQLIAGEINFGWERKINKLKSIEFEFGPTLSNIGFTVNKLSTPYIDTFSYSEESSRIGFFGSIGMRFYPLEKSVALNNFYVSPVFKYRVKNTGYTDISGNLPERTGSETNLIFTFNFGYQKWLTQNFSLDFFGGVGLAQESHRDFDIILSSTSGKQEWKQISYSGVRFSATAGIKVGIGH